MRFKIFSLLLVSAFLLNGCAFNSTNSISKSQGPEIQYNSISGKPGGDGPILAVKIDDTSLARPQIGLEKADLVYIEEVEGGLTRLAAIFSSEIPTLIGPVRSARISDIDILAQFGKVIFAYSGAQRPMYPVITAANLWDYGAQQSSPSIFTRDLARPAPYNMVLRADLLLAKAKSDERDIAISKSVGWSFGKAPEGGVAIKSATIRWPASKYEITWSISEKRWLLSNGGVADMAADGTQLGASTFVIQNVSITDSIYRSSTGGYTPLTISVGSGSGYILRDGRSFKANWERSSAESGTTWRLANGEEVSFASGSIWVALTSKLPKFDLVERSEPLSK